MTIDPKLKERYRIKYFHLTDIGLRLHRIETARFLLAELETNTRQYSIEFESQYLLLADIQRLFESFLALCEEGQK